MILSANELVALATKAARGAGAPPQQAADFGRAALCHFQRGRAPQHLRAALDALPGGPILDVPLGVTRIIEGADCAEAIGVLTLDVPVDLLQSYLDALPYAVETKPSNAGLSVVVSLETPTPAASAVRITLPGGLASRMGELAARLLVPDTAASRASGAGAGLTDND